MVMSKDFFPPHPESNPVIYAYEDTNPQYAGLLKEEVRQLREQLELRAKASFENNFYWMVEGDSKDGPFCPKCYDTDHPIRRMIKLGHLRGCPSCHLLLHHDGSGPTPQERRRFVCAVMKSKL